MELLCKVQNYDWGKVGSNSLVAQICANMDKQIEIDENKPYAELWMGTHVNGPSVLKSSGLSLNSIIKDHPELLGEETAKIFNKELPFLFKVLSVNKALSIQAHPTKEHARILHKNFPEIYKDPNHKPEIAIVLTPFEALCGFRPISEIKMFVKELPELASIAKTHASESENFLKSSFHAVLTCDKEVIRNAVDSLLKGFKVMDDNQRNKYLADLVERLFSEFPYDNGILMVYFLNYLKLKPSESVFLAANEPHAYLSGDCIENMACSDNVVRAGLTPKFVDIETLCSMLNYNGQEASTKIFKPEPEDEYTKLFKPPVQDFAVAEIRVPASPSCYSLIKRKSASILIVINGSGKNKNIALNKGTVLFLPANDILNITEISESLLIYQAFANVD